LVGVVNRELVALMAGEDDPLQLRHGLNLATTPPAIVLMAGLQGAGKTTTVGKLAKWLRETQKKKVLTVSCDVYRPAAIEQLRLVSEQAGVDFFPTPENVKPVEIAMAAVDWAKRHLHDVVLVDTAGRLAIDEAMMQEIADLHRTLKPIETLFTVDAMQGQDAVRTASAFKDTIPLTGVMLTKVDGDSRGGQRLAMSNSICLNAGNLTARGAAMQITSNLLGAGLSTYQGGQQRVEQAASAIASATGPVLGNSQAVSEITEQLIQLKVGEHSAKLGARMIQSADEVLGTLIDTQA
jgi:Ni2+-binding GTPase involved in maturation of urease and hydrogenase